MKEIRAVVDTNIFVSALLGSQTAKAIYEAFKNREFKLILSKKLFEEVKNVLHRPKLNLDSKDVAELLALIEEKAEILDISGEIHHCRDPKDDILIQTALNAQTGFIITGDKDLRALNPFRNISIIPPAEFLKMLKM